MSLKSLGFCHKETLENTTENKHGWMISFVWFPHLLYASKICQLGHQHQIRTTKVHWLLLLYYFFWKDVFGIRPVFLRRAQNGNSVLPLWAKQKAHYIFLVIFSSGRQSNVGTRVSVYSSETKRAIRARMMPAHLRVPVQSLFLFVSFYAVLSPRTSKLEESTRRRL